MKKIKYAALLLLPLVALAACNKEDVHVSRPKEVVRKEHDEGQTDITKEVYSYDKKGNVLTKEKFVYDDTNKVYVPKEKGEYTYDAKGNELSYLEHEYKDGSYKVSQKITYTYSDGKLSKNEFYDVDDEGQLYVSFYFGDLTYDSLGRLTGESKHKLDTETKEYVKDEVSTYEYKGNFSEFVKCTSTNPAGPSMFDMTIERELDDKGRVVYEIGTTFDGAYCEATFFLYNEDDELQSEASYFVDTETGAYQLLCTYDYTYVKNHYLAEKLLTYFNTDGTVKSYQTEENEFDTSMNLISHKEYELNFETKQLDLKVEENYIY